MVILPRKSHEDSGIPMIYWPAFLIRIAGADAGLVFVGVT